MDGQVSCNGKLSGGMETDITVELTGSARQGITMVTALELGELRQPDPNRPSLILRRVGNEKLWDIAKRTGSTVSAIRDANHLTEDPETHKILLIPIS